jgi:hypothetical protein
MARRIAIVSAGEWGSAKRAEGHYDELEQTFFRALEAAETTSFNSVKKERAADVKMVASAEDALQWVGSFGTIIFMTRGLIHDAKRIARDRPSVRVVVYTGLIPEGEIVFV